MTKGLTVKAKNTNLEVVRGLAAFLVVIGHIVDKLPEISRHKNHLTNLVANWGTESVIVFFVLSGLVIHSSIEKKPRNTARFLYERLIRIYPTLLISIILTTLVDAYLFNNSFDFAKALGNIIPISTLNGSISSLYWQSNPVIWSLSFEVFFYLFFAIFVLKNNKFSFLWLTIWFILGLVALKFYFDQIENSILSYLVEMMAFSLIWIVGFLIWEFNKKYTVFFSTAIFSLLCLPLISRLHLTSVYYDPLKFLLFAVVSIPIYSFLSQEKSKNQNSKNELFVNCILAVIYLISVSFLCYDNGYGLVVKVLYCTLPCLTFLFKIKAVKNLFFIFYYRVFKPLFYQIGKISYSLYLLHYPILMFVYYVFPGPIYIKIFAMLTATLILCFIMEKYIQKAINKILL